MSPRSFWLRCTRLAALGTLLGLCWTQVAHARVERFALVVGNDRGLPGEIPLQYAETDARRVHDVMRELGGFSPFNTLLLVGSDAATFRQAMIAFNARVRSALDVPGTQAMLLVYYSGHADAEALHLGASRLPLQELSGLVRGSAATFRMLVVDACQAGAMVRQKGGRFAPPFAVIDEQIAGEGIAILASSTADEAAQESDELRASFFTHAFVSGLLGAADRDRDGSVVLEEAYRYAYDSTLRSTSRSAFNMQHPTFSYDLRGQGKLVLTRPGSAHEARGTLELPQGASYLVLKDSADGAVVAEVGRADPGRSLSLPDGRYFLRGRAPAYLLEGSVSVVAREHTRVEPRQLTRIEYAHLARKGAGAKSVVHAVELGARLRTALPNAETPCPGAFLGYRLDLRRAALDARLGACTGRSRQARVDTRTNEYDLALRAAWVRDLHSKVSIELGGGAGLSFFTQDYATQGLAPARRSVAGQSELYGALVLDAPHGLYAGVELAGQLYVMKMLVEHDQSSTLRAAFAGRAALSFGKRF
jgi:hypothetical protein